MSVLIRNGRVDRDEYVALGEDESPPEATPVLVGLVRWLKEGASLAANERKVGVRLPNTADVLALSPSLRDRPLIALDFPSFGDGRAYSQAHLLRERCDYQGEIRATGAAVVRDQILGMQRSGFSAFQLRADQNPEDCLEALKDFSLAYQPGLSALPLVPVLRRKTLSR